MGYVERGVPTTMTELEDEIMSFAPLADFLERMAMLIHGEDYVRNEVGVEGKTVPEIVDEYRTERDHH